MANIWKTKLAGSVTYLLLIVSFSQSAKAADECQEAFNLPTALQNLQQKIQEDANLIPHELKIRDRRGFLHIGMLKGEDKTIAKALLIAVRAGDIAEIDSGNIIGPKILKLLTGVPRLNPTTNPLRIKGHLDARLILKKMKRPQQQLDEEGRINVQHFAENDIDDFYDSVKALKIEESCAELFGKSLTQCGDMQFEMDAQNPGGIRWSRYQPVKK